MATTTHNQTDEITPVARSHHTTATGATATSVVAATASGRYRIVRVVDKSLIRAA
jgi:hypothetical protein